MTTCPHNSITSTTALGPHCFNCKEPLAGFLWPISRNTPAGALIWAMRTAPTTGEQS
jgi:hypothetical protein